MVNAQMIGQELIEGKVSRHSIEVYNDSDSEISEHSESDIES